MKKISILLLSLVFTACGAGSDNSLDSNDGEVNSNELSVEASEIADLQSYNLAVSNNDIELCTSIQDEEKKLECEQVVAANVLTAEATRTKDVNVCDDIDLERFKENCVATVEGLIENDEEIAERISEIENEAEENSQISTNALENNDLEACTQLEDQALKTSCETNIYLKRANEAQDPSICDQIESEEYVELCKQPLL